MSESKTKENLDHVKVAETLDRISNEQSIIGKKEIKQDMNKPITDKDLSINKISNEHSKKSQSRLGIIERVWNKIIGNIK